jgi:hypothetical protein
LNIYEFQRISSGPDKNAYYHLSFQRGRHDLLSRIKRVTIKGTGIRKAPTPEDEPDFYQMMPGSDAAPSTAALSSEAVRGPLPSAFHPSYGVGAALRTLTRTAPLTPLDLLSSWPSMGCVMPAISTASLYAPPATSLDLGWSLHRAQQLLEERQWRDTLTQLSALEQMRNRTLDGQLRTSDAPALLPPSTDSLLQRFLLKNGTRHFS